MLLLRLRGARAAVQAALARLGSSAAQVVDAGPGRRRSGAACATTATSSSALRERGVETDRRRALWRLSLPQTAPPLHAARRPADRMGRRAALAVDDAGRPAQVRDAAAQRGGHATLFRAQDKIGRRLRAAAVAARPDPSRTEEGVRPGRAVQSAADSTRGSEPRPHRCRPISLPNSRAHADGEAAEAILRKCVHCGFCTATCPTYQLLGDELDGPRGRIYLMKQVLEGAAVDPQHAAAPRPLPDLPQLREHLPVGRAVRQAGRYRTPRRRREGASGRRPSEPPAGC